MKKTNNEMWVRKTIILSPHSLEIAQKLANKWYAGNLSAFIAARIEISQQCEHCQINNTFKNHVINEAQKQNISVR